MTCHHTKHHQIGADRGFSGSVAASEATTNRAAHGSISYEEECLDCGARRRVNQNQKHLENGPWGPTRAEQIARVKEYLSAARAKAPPIPSPVTVSSKARGVSVRVICGPDGYILIEGEHTKAETEAILRVVPEAFIEAAKELRLHACWVSSLETALQGAA